MIQFSHKDAAQIVDCAVELSQTEATDEKALQPVAVCGMRSDQGIHGMPTAFRMMDAVKATSAQFAINKAYTVLLYNSDTKKHADRIRDGSWSEADMILQQSVFPQFTPWDGGIQIKDDDGNVIASLGVAGRTSEGDRKLAVLSAHKMGYKTNFDAEGN